MGTIWKSWELCLHAKRLTFTLMIASKGKRSERSRGTSIQIPGHPTPSTYLIANQQKGQLAALNCRKNTHGHGLVPIPSPAPT